MSYLSRLVMLAGMAALVALPASGQSTSVRKGFWGAIGVGTGSLTCTGCAGSSSSAVAHIALGGTLSPQVSLGVLSQAWVKSEYGATLSLSSLTAAVRYYPSATGNVFLMGGLGTGRIEIDLGSYGEGSAYGASATLGIGVDIRVGSSLSLTPALSAFSVQDDGSRVTVGQLTLGLTFH